MGTATLLPSSAGILPAVPRALALGGRGLLGTRCYNSQKRGPLLLKLAQPKRYCTTSVMGVVWENDPEVADTLIV